MEQIIQVSVGLDYDDQEIRRAVQKKYGLQLKSYELYHRSLDARKKELKFHLKLLVDTDKRWKDAGKKPATYTLPKTQSDAHVAVIGAGPAGLYAAHILSSCGAKVDLYERGSAMEQRIYDVRKFQETAILNPESNISFGEGGAGTFSDGKLTSRSKDSKKEYVKHLLTQYGAPEEILIAQKPHIGTDRMRKIMFHFRRDLENRGVRCFFNTRLESLDIQGGRAVGVYLRNAQGKEEHKAYDKVILAIGNAARDTFLMLLEQGVTLESKPFSVGMRIEHPQIYVDRCQFRDAVGHPRLLRGEYNLTAQTDGAGVYSFCMCPGGIVVPSASEENHLSVNGMSYHDRALPNANAAIVATVEAPDHPREAIGYQREIERRAFQLGGGKYAAPAIHVQDFLEQRKPKTKSQIIPSYPMGVRFVEVDDIFEKRIVESLRQGLVEMERKMHGFTEDAILTAVESKTSSPVRIPRTKEFQTNVEGLYVCGEGAGYAGGIVSAALDGLKCAEQVLEVPSERI